MNKELEEMVIDLLTGILYGDGDVASRMASGAPNAEDPYPQPLQKQVNAAYKAFEKSQQRGLSNAEVKRFINNAVAELNAQSFQMELVEEEDDEEEDENEDED
jgi:hypothetical protein